MFPIQDQISVATKANLDAQFAMFTSLTNKTLESVEQLLKLNITAFKASMQESTAKATQILAAKDPQEFITLVSAQAQPNVEKALAYGSHLASIASTTQAEFTKAAEMQIAAVKRKVNELVDDAAKKAPAGSESFIDVIKSAMDSANTSFEQFSKTGKQAMEAVEANVAATVSQFAKTAMQTAGVKK